MIAEKWRTALLKYFYKLDFELLDTYDFISTLVI